ncbi:hypothetical protein OJAV_G00183350 [Oryzias javanicus]|uniref:C2 domain-containing protein n=1 Tax=Oryzias javanicus TaxID=123683 RepID=A0A3S2PTQ9_ORYJA|nr:hypothetical protein OJAV_G00183350 [Oryzias javanicus]
MSPVVDETAGDLPVRDVGLMRGGLMPAQTESMREVKTWKKQHIMKIKADPKRLFRFPREHLEDLCLRLQEENSVLKQHTRTQEQRLRRMSTRLTRLRQASPGSGGRKDRDMEDTIQELEARVVMLESQKGVLQNKLSLAKQHIVDMGVQRPYKFSRCKNLDGEGGVRRAAQTAPPRYGLTLEDTRTDVERLRTSMAEQVRMAELEMTAQALRDSLRDREKEMEGTMRELRKQQADRHRITIRENVDLIRLQKQLSEKSVALRVMEEKFTSLQQAFENQLEESQRSMKECQVALLEKVEELNELLKQERQRSLDLEGQLTSTSLSAQNMDKLQERISDLEGERDLIKENYDSLLTSTLSSQIKNEDQDGQQTHVEQKRESVGENIHRHEDLQRLEEMLLAERGETRRLQEELKKLRQEKEMLEEQKEREEDVSVLVRRRQEGLEQEVIHYKERVSALQDRLDSVTKEFDMSAEELSETLLQIKAFRMQQESREGLNFLTTDGKTEDPTKDFAHAQAKHAETVLELQKTRNLLLLEHQITKDLQEELKTIIQRLEQERDESRRRMAEKDKLLSKRAAQINTLHAQLKELAYSPRNYKRTIPIQYTWPAGDQEVAPPIEDDLYFSQLKAGESLLEIHLKAAAFTPAGLRLMSNAEKSEDMVTFCTFCLLDFEMNCTPQVSGSQPNYGFTSRYGLTARDLGRLEGQGSRVQVELHQALGGVRFVTFGRGHMSLVGAMERRGEKVSGRFSVTGSGGEMVGVVDFWARLFPPAEPIGFVKEGGAERRTGAVRGPPQVSYGWQDSSQEELHDHGGGIPNELVVVLERCVGLSARWPGLLPDAYLTYRLYDLPPHVSQTVQCSADPVLNDITSYPLAVTNDMLQYLRSSSLWVYVFDDSDDQIPPAYLAKTPVPLRGLASGREIRGDYVLRDPAGGPRGVVRVMVKWKYPFQPLMESLEEKRGKKVEEQRKESAEQKEKQREDASQKPIAKPRVKPQEHEQDRPKSVQKETEVRPRPPAVRQKSSQDVRTICVTSAKSLDARSSTSRKRSSRMSSERYQRSLHLTPEPRLSTATDGPPPRSSVGASSKRSVTVSRGSSVSDARTRNLLSVDQASAVGDQEERSESGESDAPESSESSASDMIVIPPKRKPRTGDKLRVEILSLAFEPSSRVALDESVQRVYVEYRLLGVPMETTETPMSLRKPREGEEIHYNFTRVIYVDGSQSAPLRQHLYTMLEGTDPNQGRLKFSVVSEPMDDNEECVDVGQAFLDLQELLLTGNDVIEQQIDIVSVDEDQEVMGNLKVSLEAAKALTGIYQEFHNQDDSRKKTMKTMMRSQHVSQLLHNKFVVVLGDSIQRGVYKDLVLILQSDRYLTQRQLKSKGEMSFEQDCLVEGGCLNQMNNGTEYREVRQFQSNHHLVRFYFVTRVFSRYMESILEDFQALKPDVVIVNSCVWDISRYNSSWLDDYQENLHRFFRELSSVLPEETLVIWNLTMPLGKSIRGGFLVPEIEYKAPTLRFDVIDANFYSGTLADAYQRDVLDLHFHFRFFLHHRTNDGVHWNAVAHRNITYLLLEHIAQAWRVDLPDPLKALGEEESCLFPDKDLSDNSDHRPLSITAPKAAAPWNYNGYKEEFSSDSLPSNFLNFEDRIPKVRVAADVRAAARPEPSLPGYRQTAYGQARNGFDSRPPYHFEPYRHQNHPNVMRSRNERFHYAPYTHHRRHNGHY